MANLITKVALVGGPCAGKSNVLATLQAEYGDAIMIMEEVASQILAIPFDQGGPGVPGVDVEYSQEWQDKLQERILEKQIADEFKYVQEAEQLGRPIVIIIDRGILDGCAFLAGGKEEFVEKFNLNPEACLALYDKVIHLDSLAVDMPELYNQLKATNASRFETDEQARTQDERLYQAYEGHPDRIRITNEGGIESKIELSCVEIRKSFDVLKETIKELNLEQLNEGGMSFGPTRVI